MNPYVTKKDHAAIQEYLDILSEFQELFGEQAYQELLNQESIIDKTITDILHYIEFKNLSAAQGFNIYKLLQEKLKERRAIKDKTGFVFALRSSKTMQIINGSFSAKHSKDTAIYTPRVLTDLFD